MAEVTQAELNKLQREVAETRYMVEMLILRGLDKEARREWDADQVQGWLDDALEQREYLKAFGKDGVYGHGLFSDAVEALIETGLRTLPDVAQQPRERVAAIHGVGRVSIKRLDAALAERNLTWAEAS